MADDEGDDDLREDAAAIVPVVSEALGLPMPRSVVTKSRVNCVNFTRAGGELRKIVHMTPNEAYVAKLVEWISKTFKLSVQT